MTQLLIGFVVGVAVTVGFWLTNRWYWKSMYLSERDYAEKLSNYLGSK